MADNEYEEIPYVGRKEIDYAALFLKLWKNWKSILLWAVIAGVLGVLIGLCMPRVYTVTSKLSPELSSRTTSNSNLSSLASMAGVNISSLTGNSDAFRPDLYPEIIRSVPFITDLFDMPVSFKRKKETIETTYFDYMLSYQRHAWWEVVASVPFTVSDWLRGVISPEEEDVEEDLVHPAVDNFRLTKSQTSVVKAVRERISATVDRKNYMLTLSYKDQDKVIAAQVSQLIIDNLTRYITEYRTEKARQDLEYYQKIYDEAKDDYQAKQREYALYVDSHQGSVSRISQIRQVQLQNEYNLQYQVFTTASQQLQLAKAKVQQETPVMACIQPPTVPLKGKPSKWYMLFTYACVGFFLAILWFLFVKDLIVGFRKKLD